MLLLNIIVENTDQKKQPDCSFNLKPDPDTVLASNSGTKALADSDLSDLGLQVDIMPQKPT